MNGPGPVPLPSVKLDESYYNMVNNQLRAMGVAREQLDCCLRGGVDCGDTPAVCDFLKQQFEQRKATFFPNRP